MSEIIPTGWQIVGVGDFNGDGYADLLLRSDDGTITDWLGSQNDGFSDNSATVLSGNPNPGSSWHVIGTGDFNADGRSDIFFRNDTGAVTDWLGNTTANFTGNWDNLHAVLPANVAIDGIGDYNGDRIDDLLLRDSNGGVAEWLGQANGGFTANREFANPEPGSSWQVVGTGDFNGDGLTDLLWRNDDGTVTDWLGTASGSFNGNWDIFHSNPGTVWAVDGVGDFNGDHKADILWRAADGTITDWLGQADGAFADNWATASQFVSTDLQIAGVGDFNGDGRSDLLFRYPDGTLETWVGAADGTFVGTQSSFEGAIPTAPAAASNATWEIPVGPDWDQTTSQLQAFFDEMEARLESAPSAGNDQNSYYRDPADYDQPTPTFLNDIGIFTHDQLDALWNSYSTFPYESSLIDPEFATTAFSSDGFTAQYSDGVASVFGLTDHAALFAMPNGSFLMGQWHSGQNPGPGGPTDPIVITGGGYWSFTSLGYAPSYSPNVFYDFSHFAGTTADDAITADILDGQRIDTSALGNLDAHEFSAVSKLGFIIMKVTLMLASLPADGRLIAADGKMIEIGELQELWARTDFQLDPAGWFHDVGYGNGGVGQAIRNNGDPIFRIDVEQLYNYMNGSSDLALHYVLHELMHVTSAGQQVLGTSSTESWTSRMAAALASAAGVPYQGNFIPPGYANTWGPAAPATYQSP